MNLNFDPTLLAVIYSYVKGENSVTKAQLAAFDQQLSDNYRDDLIRIMQQRELPIDKLSQSKVLAYLPGMPGNTPELQIQNACIFFQSVENAISNL
jgi:hypothetical protein